ncbi:MAG: hypothetical protein PHF20_04670 [Halothiobacillaceae bacterium]|nr:hypothetical protein [Halothiobacillaceae bacterium]
MSFRLRMFFFHLSATSVVLTLVLGSLYLGWYSWPGWYLTGADGIVGLLVLIDLLVGSFATLLVSNPTKARHLLRLDWSVIVLVQVAALMFGSWTLWQGRPLFYVFSLDRIELATAAQFDEENMTRAREKSAKIMPSWSSVPQWVWAPLPENEEEATAIIYSAITEGKDVTSMPEYFRPWADGLPKLRERLQPMSGLREKLKLDDTAYTNLLHELGENEAALGWLLIQGGKREGVMIFTRANGGYLRFLSMPAAK